MVSFSKITKCFAANVAVDSNLAMTNAWLAVEKGANTCITKTLYRWLQE
jgi:hypothetical protein